MALVTTETVVISTITQITLYDNNVSTPTVTDLVDVSDVTMTTTGFNYKDFVELVDEDGASLTFNFESIDTATYTALNAATDLTEVLDAWQGLQELILNVTAGADTPQTFRLRIYEDRYAIVDTIPVYFTQHFITYSESLYYEFIISNATLYLEFLVETPDSLYLEFLVADSTLYFEFLVEPFPALYLEFLVSNPTLYYEFLITSEEIVLQANLKEEITTSDDCLQSTVELNIALLPAETVVVEVTRGEEMMILETYAGTDTSYTFNTTEDGLYYVTVTSNQRGLLARRPYIVDCRTQKCITRIAIEDIENDMYCNDGDRTCKQNKDYLVIFATWRTIYASYSLAQYTLINGFFNRLKKYCRECNQASCGS